VNQTAKELLATFIGGAIGSGTGDWLSKGFGVHGRAGFIIVLACTIVFALITPGALRADNKVKK